MSLRVEQLCAGWLVREKGMVIEAHSTSSIILGGSQIIVVDTSDTLLRPDIIRSLDRLGIKEGDVDVVINTHGHPDHCSNNDLFRNAAILAHPAEGVPRSSPEVKLEEGVRTVLTPGHTAGSIAVFVEGEKRTAIAGDALPTRDNYVKMVPPGHNYDPELALASMRRIIEWAEVVVPGHGPAFDVVH